MCIHKAIDPSTCKRCTDPNRSTVMKWREPTLSTILKYTDFPEEIQKGEIRMFKPEMIKSEWLTIRRKILERDKTCRVCFSGEKLVVHHIDHSGDGAGHRESNNSPENLIVLCRSCHSTVHQKAYKRIGQQYLDQSGAVYNKSTMGTYKDERMS